MSRPSNPVPTYRHHKQSGQAIVTLTDGLGGRRDVLLGTYGTKASRSEYSRVMARWEASGRRLSNQYGVSVNELAVAFLKHAEQHYRHPDGTPTNEVVELKMCLRPVVHLHGHAPATEFGPLALRAVRQIMIDGYDHPKYGPQAALARGVVNSRTNRIRRAFKWGVANELVPASVLHALQAVTGLQRGRTEARETEPVRPVDPDVVEQTMPFRGKTMISPFSEEEKAEQDVFRPSPPRTAIAFSCPPGRRPWSAECRRSLGDSTRPSKTWASRGSNRGSGARTNFARMAVG